MKKKLTMCLSVALIAVMAICGTLAYLTSEDSDVNVMTLGNVEIEQIELERDDNGNLKMFSQAKPLYPAVYDDENAWQPVMSENDPNSIHFAKKDTENIIDGIPEAAWCGLWDADKISNVQDKMVFVKNTGKSDLYYRTIIAFESDTTDFYDVYGDDLIHYNSNGNSRFVGLGSEYEAVVEDVMIAGVEYDIWVVTYKEKLTPGEVSRPSLLQVGMDKKANNEHVSQFGDTYDILVYSQAVQAEGFNDALTALDAAFGDITADNHPWVDGIDTSVVTTADELTQALEDGKNIVLINDVEMQAKGSNAYGKTAINVLNGQTIDGGNNVLAAVGANGTWDSAINTTGGTIKNLTIASGFRGVFINHNSTESSRVILENVTIDGPTYTISCDQGTNNGLKAVDSTFNGWTSYAATVGNVEFINCNFGEGAGNAFCRPYAPTSFKNCEFEAGYELDARAAVTFENCKLGGVALTADNLATLVTSNITNATVK